MAKKTAPKQADFVDNTVERAGEDFTYRAHLKVENTTIATITLRASNDDEAREMLRKAQPPAFEGIGVWELTKQVTQTVEV